MVFVVFHFGVPRVVVTDNGMQFVGEKFEAMLAELKIKHLRASIAYPRVNSQVEVTNRIILQGIKKRIQDMPDCWTDELPNVLWSYRTTPRSSTGETPFSLAYRVEVVLPVEVSLRSPNIEVFYPEKSFEGLRLDNDLMKEIRDYAALLLARYQAKVASYFTRKLSQRTSMSMTSSYERSRPRNQPLLENLKLRGKALTR